MPSIWIVGASSGIGAEVARLYVRNGWKVLISARGEDKLNAVASEHENMFPFALDIADVAACERVVADVVAQHGVPDIVVLNAAVWHPMGIENFDRDKIEQSINVNYIGVINMLAQFMPHWTSNKAGHVAIVASVAGYRGLPNSLAYAPTKAALINLSEGLRTQLEPYDVNVSMITPGFVDTPMTQKNDFPMPGLISPEKAAEFIKKGLDAKRFEISFPPLFSAFMQVIRTLPNWLFFLLNRQLNPKK